MRSANRYEHNGGRVGCNHAGLHCGINDLSTAPAADFEAARARWEAAEDAEEATVERVARALEEACVDYGRCTWQHLARAAIAAITTPVRQETGR